MQRVEIENEGNQPEENKFELNPDHSHFVIVRDSTINKTGINHFLLKLEQYLSSSESLHCDIDAATPRRHPDVCSLYPAKMKFLLYLFSFKEVMIVQG
ncbi:transient receptor potential cation channel subfamily M member 6 [Nephila pilipes]|uniref:Transient receptor potential cation channel subfamily M member 6 n=1 Tax=Nephila pilipes TaxID=299642 RepID=A0A8X6Q105_NEPPI|nr:transient receptor potential cation channel subfamily M member 6 [Nephila pilipes]